MNGPAPPSSDWLLPKKIPTKTRTHPPVHQTKIDTKYTKCPLNSIKKRAYPKHTHTHAPGRVHGATGGSSLRGKTKLQPNLRDNKKQESRSQPDIPLGESEPIQGELTLESTSILLEASNESVMAFLRSPSLSTLVCLPSCFQFSSPRSELVDYSCPACDRDDSADTLSDTLVSIR
jgi:hypothetical protein